MGCKRKGHTYNKPLPQKGMGDKLKAPSHCLHSTNKPIQEDAQNRQGEVLFFSYFLLS